MKPRPLNPHALEMLRLIGSIEPYWRPQEKNQISSDAGGTFDIFIEGNKSTGAIRTLTSQGLVEAIAGAMAMGGSGKWARRITPKGREVLDAYLKPFIEQRKINLAKIRANQDLEDDHEDF